MLATMLWGFAFIAQKYAIGHMGPLTYNGARYILGGLLILPLALREYKRRGLILSLRQWWLIGFLSFNFFMASYLQQYGLEFTTVTNAGFLTGFYVFFVPAILLIVFRTAPHPIVWLCAPLALTGLFFLNGGHLDNMNFGDVVIVACAVFWGLHVLIARLSRPRHRPAGAGFLPQLPRCRPCRRNRLVHLRGADPASRHRRLGRDPLLPASSRLPSPLPFRRSGRCTYRPPMRRSSCRAKHFSRRSAAPSFSANACRSSAISVRGLSFWPSSWSRPCRHCSGVDNRPDQQPSLFRRCISCPSRNWSRQVIHRRDNLDAPNDSRHFIVMMHK